MLHGLIAPAHAIDRSLPESLICTYLWKITARSMFVVNQADVVAIGAVVLFGDHPDKKNASLME